jgi:hypothetical protein
MIIRLSALAVLTTILGVRPAAAYFVINWPDGSATYLSEDFVLFVIVIAIGFVALVVWSFEDGGNAQVPDASESTEFYDSEAARFRALGRKLDAETDLAESVIKAKRTRAELDEIEEMFQDGKPKRRR